MKMDDLLTLKEVAERFAVSQRTVRRWIEDGKIRAYRPGGKLIRIDAHSLDFLYEEVHYKRKTSFDATPKPDARKSAPPEPNVQIWSPSTPARNSFGLFSLVSFS
jgi:excisionase family DNA binding protein